MSKTPHISSGFAHNSFWFERAQKVMPGGVNSPVRSFRSVGGTPYFVDKAKGAYVWDVEGTRYIDYVQSYGASVLGHAHDEVIDAIREAALDGTTYGAPTAREVLLAETIIERVPGLEMLRLTSSGTEAAQSAIRLARGYTGRDKIVKFAGCYHGHTDSLLASAGSGLANQSLPDSAGVPAGAVADTIVVPYNEVPTLDESIAVVAVEPIAANMGLVAPAPGFLEALRAECTRVGAVLLFDEVITGFRVARGGATQYFGVQPDVWCFGKIIGGGLPVGAFGASRQIMQSVAPLGPVYQGGTLSGNPLATAAGLAVMNNLTDDAYKSLEANATELQMRLVHAFGDADVAVQVPRVGTLVGMFLTGSPVQNFDQATAAASNGRFAPFFHALLNEGVAIAPGPYEALFPSVAHTPDVLDETEAAVRRALITAGDSLR